MRKCCHVHRVDLLQDKKNLEYLEAAVLLHATGFLVGRKDYHKHSYHVIKVLFSEISFLSDSYKLFDGYASRHLILFSTFFLAV